MGTAVSSLDEDPVPIDRVKEVFAENLEKVSAGGGETPFLVPEFFYFN